MEAKNFGSVETTLGALLSSGAHGEAVEVALREVGPAVRRFLRSRLRDDDLAADAYSVFCAKVWRHLGTYRGDAPFRCWAFRVASNAARSVRADSWNRLAQRLDDRGAEGWASEDATEPSWLREERRARVLTAIRDRLRPEEQELIRLRIDDELRWDEAARLLTARGERVDAVTLRKRFERVKATLRTLVTQAAAEA